MWLGRYGFCGLPTVTVEDGPIANAQGMDFADALHIGKSAYWGGVGHIRPQVGQRGEGGRLRRRQGSVKGVARELDAVIAIRGCPAMIVSDNGTELISTAMLRWSQERRNGTPKRMPQSP
jgi:hypothetical protein